MSIQKVWGFQDCNVSFAGPTGAFSLKGGVAAEGITVTWAQDNATSVWGAGGDWVHSLIAAKGAEVTVRLLKNSVTNALLSTQYDAQKTSTILSGQNTITIDDTLGDAILLTGVIFKKHPMVTFAQEAQIIEWSFTAGKVEAALGLAV